MIMTADQARKKIMDYLAIRDYSELELRQKSEAKCEFDFADDALGWVKKQMWMLKPDQLQENVVDQLNRRRKGIDIAQKILKDELKVGVLAHDEQ